MKKSYLILFFVLILSGFNQCKIERPSSQYNLLDLNKNRLAAEWEPAIGVMITWPLHVPHKLVVELAKDTKLFTLIPEASIQSEAEKWYNKWNINLANVQFVVVPQDVDASWVRDWGPHAVFNTGNEMKLGDGQYIYSTPVTGFDCDDELGFIFTSEKGEIIRTLIEDKAPIQIAEQLNFDILELPFVFTGGNVLTDGMGGVFSTCIITNENEYDGLSESDFLEKAEKLVGAKRYHIISNFEERGIQHIDCFMKILDEERILVARPPKDHEYYTIYENIVNNELAQLKTVYNRPYQILRLDSDRYFKEELAAYTNSLILNQTIYVPLFDIPQDTTALKQWKEFMPGYTVKGFNFRMNEEPILAELAYQLYNEIGWTGGDALHCRTRAIWDPEMLFISVNLLDNEISQRSKYIIEVQIVDYSKQEIKEDSQILYWKIKGSNSWSTSKLAPVGKKFNFKGTIPMQDMGQIIEYYVAAESHSGRSETKPRTAPKAYYTFKIIN